MRFDEQPIGRKLREMGEDAGQGRQRQKCAKQNTRRLVLATTVSGMSSHHARRRRVKPIEAAVVRPVAKRLSRNESLLVEIRYEQDIQLRRACEAQLIPLAAQVSQRANHRGASRRADRKT
jgi:hypothetical protein